MLTRSRQARADAYRADMLERIARATADARTRRTPPAAPEDLRRS